MSLDPVEVRIVPLILILTESEGEWKQASKELNLLMNREDENYRGKLAN